MSADRPCRCTGFSLIEMVIFIVIVGTALAGVVAVLDATVLRSADPMLAKQSIAVGEAFLDEILSREYASNSTYSGAAVDPRSNFDDVADYGGYDSSAGGIKTRSNQPVTGLEKYRVQVSVAAEAAINGAPMREVTVTV